MTVFRTWLAAGIATLALATMHRADAQALGTYSGSQANGVSITFTVTTDNANSKPEITSFGLGIVGSCTGNITVNTGYGVGTAQDIVGDKAKIVFNGSDTVYFTASVTFNPSSNTASGTITAYTVIFVPPASGHPPTKAAFCHTGAQTFTASLSGSAVAALAPGVVVH